MGELFNALFMGIEGDLSVNIHKHKNDCPAKLAVTIIFRRTYFVIKTYNVEVE